MAYRTELVNQILSATPLYRDIADIISKLLVPDVRPIIEKITLYLLITKSNISSYFTCWNYTLSDNKINSLSDYIECNERYLHQWLVEDSIILSDYVRILIGKDSYAYDSATLDEIRCNISCLLINMFPIMHCFEEKCMLKFIKMFEEWLLETFT